MRKDKSRMSYIFTALITFAAGYLALCALVYFRQSSYVYYPTREVAVTPEYYDLDYEELRLKTEDGETIHAWFVDGRKGPGSPDAVEGGDRTRATILFCHGNGGNISDRVYTLEVLCRMGFDVLIFDYRGYGGSTGSPDEAGTYSDASACWRHLVENRGIDPGKIALFGRSLGGAVAARLASIKNPGALIIESTFTSAPDMGARMFPFLPVRLLSRFRYRTIEAIKELNCPVLIAHSRDDEMVPFEHGQRLFTAAREPKVFVKMSGSHNEGGLESNNAYQERFTQFLSEYVTGR
ncbi:MAG: alpha/beta hydrolase [Verrucomicrobiota bacterium]